MATFNDFGGTKIVGDTFLWKANPNSTPDTSDSMGCGGDSESPFDQQLRFIIQWDNLTQPLGRSTINTAKINFAVEFALSTTRSIEVKKILRGVNFTGTSWNNYSTGQSWQIAGAEGANDSISFSPIITHNGPTATGTWEFTGLAAAVQDAVDNLDGRMRLMFLPYLWGTTNTDDFYVYTVDEVIDHRRPELIVDYTPDPEKRYSIGSISKTNELFLSGSGF